MFLMANRHDGLQCARMLAAALSGLGWLMGGAAHAARPMITDDARIVDAKACQLESWVKHPKGHAEFWALPACNFSGNLELTAGGALTRMDGSTRTSAQLLQGKTLLKPMESNGWGVALALGMSRDPRRDAGGGHDMYAYMPVSFAFRDDRLLVHTNVGWLREQGSRSQHLTWGLSTEAQLQQHTWLIAETFGQGTGKPFMQFGLRYWLVPDKVQIDATYGNRVGEGSQRWFSLGLRLLSVPFLP